MKPFHKLNHYMFDFIVSKEAKIIFGIIYFSVWAIGLFFFEPLSQVKNGNGGFQMSLLCYMILLCLITLVTYCFFLQFIKYATDIAREAKSVGLSDLEMKSVHKCLNHIMWHYVPTLGILLSLGITFAFISNTDLELSSVRGLKEYAGFLVFCAALSTILAYASLILDVFAIWLVYNGTFKEYVFFYPVSTKIFREYNKIITRGLIRFWLVCAFVLFLTFIVVTYKNSIFIFVMFLVVFGFILFTFFPFYITKKKIIELKMQTIASLVAAKDSIDDQHIRTKESTVKFVQESPSQISTNYYTLYWSSFLALISTIISLKDLFPYPF